MSKNRMYPPSIWSNVAFVECSHEARLLYLGMLTSADDDGRYVGTLRSLKIAFFPGDMLSYGIIHNLVSELEDAGLVHGDADGYSGPNGWTIPAPEKGSG